MATKRAIGLWKALNIEPRVSGPLDARTYVPSLADLTDSTWWGDTTFYQGLTVTVFSNQSGEPSIYVLLDASSPYLLDSWFEIKGSSSGGSGSGSGDELDYGDSYVKHSEANIAYGYAKLDGNAKILTSLLPSYVSLIITKDTIDDFPNYGDEEIFSDSEIKEGITAIYIDALYRLTYRWVGVEKGQCGPNNGYVLISASLVIGEILGTAFDGSRGRSLEQRTDVLEDVVGKYDEDDDTEKTLIERLENLITWHEG